MSEISDRFEQLHKMRETLCKKRDKFSEIFYLQDWLVNNLKDLVKQAESEKIKKEDIVNALEDLICVVEPEDEEDDK